MQSFIIDLRLKSRQCVAQLLVHMQSSLFSVLIKVYITKFFTLSLISVMCMLVNLFHGYSHIVNRVVFSCNMFPGHLIGLGPRYCYDYKLFGVAI